MAIFTSLLYILNLKHFKGWFIGQYQKSRALIMREEKSIHLASARLQISRWANTSLTIRSCTNAMEKLPSLNVMWNSLLPVSDCVIFCSHSFYTCKIFKIFGLFLKSVKCHLIFHNHFENLHLACDCPKMQTVKSFVRKLRETTVTHWSVPVPRCLRNRIMNVEELPVGNHTRTYNYTYSSKNQAFDIQCHVRIVVTGMILDSLL